MEWNVLLIFGLAVGVIIALRRLSLISAKAACQFLKQGAAVVDVRSQNEFKQRHVLGAVNIPLSELSGTVPGRFPDRQQVLLVHCLGGGRSALAKRWLKANGYTRVFNLGSYGRAERIVHESEHQN